MSGEFFPHDELPAGRGGLKLLSDVCRGARRGECFCRLCGAALEIIHASEQDSEKEARFRAVLPDCPIRWGQGTTPSEAILATAKDCHHDLLIAGALRSEESAQPFTNGVARELLNQAPCDLLLLPSPA